MIKHSAVDQQQHDLLIMISKRVKLYYIDMNMMA